MAKDKDFYFENFKSCAGLSLQAAEALKKIVLGFDSSTLASKNADLHAIEHEGDRKQHELGEKLLKAFITPIERDDIFSISRVLDDLTDDIEEIALKMYMMNVQAVREDAMAFSELLVRSCQAVCDLFEEFPQFRKTSHLKEKVIAINSLEEEGDRLYSDAMHRLFTGEQNPLEVFVWSEILTLFENCTDTCEEIANIVEGVAIGNL